MPRRLVAFLVALLLACSGANAVARALLPAIGDEHVPVHMAGAGHHHADGQAKAGDTEGLAQLCECDDGASDPTLLVQAWAGVAVPPPGVAPAEPPGAALPAPFIEGPRRPPRA